MAKIVLDVVWTEPGPTVEKEAICGLTAQHKYKTRCGIPITWVKEHVGNVSCAACLWGSDKRQVVLRSTKKAM